VGCLEYPILLALAALIVYVLAILLRVACHFCRVEIPALGRAYFTAGASAGLSVVVALLIFSFVAGLTRGGYTPSLQLVALPLMLAENMLISVALYAPLLEVRWGQALTIWVVQAIGFLAFGLLLGCCAGGISCVQR
jgi:hypothetical protein